MPNPSSNSGKSGDENTRERGFVPKDEEEQREIARKRGETGSEDREHLGDIGRKGTEGSREERGGGGRSGGGHGGQSGGQGGGNRGGNR